MNPGIAAIITPLIFILENTPLSSITPSLFPEPITGEYFIFQNLLNDVTAATALVLFVVPVVPEDDITLAPIALIVAIDVPPVPTIGIFFSAAARIALLFIPSGSQLITINPSIIPSFIFSASFLSYSNASLFISGSFFSSLDNKTPFSK